MSTLFNARDRVIKFIEDYSPMILGAKRLAKLKGTGPKLLAPNQMLKRLPITCTNKSRQSFRKFINEIRQLVYCLYRSKKNIKKVYNNIIKSIKV